MLHGEDPDYEALVTRLNDFISISETGVAGAVGDLIPTDEIAAGKTSVCQAQSLHDVTSR